MHADDIVLMPESSERPKVKNLVVNLAELQEMIIKEKVEGWVEYRNGF